MKLRLQTGDGPAYGIEVVAREDEWHLVAGDRVVRAQVLDHGDGRLVFTLDGRVHTAHVAVTASEVEVWLDGATTTFRRMSGDARLAGGADAHGPTAEPEVRAAVPGKVLQVIASPGMSVESGDPLVVIEAMKMEHSVVAEAKGRVVQVHVVAGEAVKLGALLVTCEWEATPQGG